MAKGLGSHIRAIGWYLVGIGCFLSPLACSPSEATSGMPTDQRAYWSWVGTINEGGSSALASGIALLEDMPHLPALYLRLAEVCLEEDAVAACQEAYRRVQPPDSLTLLYREAALARLHTQSEADTTGRYWLPIAQDPRLDPTLARLIVDGATMQQHLAWLDVAEETWHKALAADSSKAGAAFGLGYAAVKRYEWDEGERLLQHVTELLPNDSQAYRELGRIYYTKKQQEKLEATLERGIVAAQVQHDLDQELTLSGNLGWSLFLSDGDLEKAERFLKEALAQSRALSEKRDEGFSLYRLANLYTRQYRYDEALAILDSADAIYTKHIPDRRLDVLVLQGDILSIIYRLSEADSLLRVVVSEAEKQNRRSEKVQALSSLTMVQYEMGKYAAARMTGLEALELSQQDQLVNSEMRARIMLGNVEYRWGNFEAATTHFEQGLVLAKQSQSINAQYLASRLGHMALSLEDATTAKKRFEDLLTQETHYSDLAKAYRGLGDAYMQFNNIDEAISYYNKALQQLPEQEYMKVRQGILSAKAEAMLAAAQPDSAIALLQKIQQANLGGLRQTYFLESGLGRAYLEKRMFEVALQHFQEADVIEQQLYLPSVHWSVLFGKALAYWHLNQFAEAETAFQEAIGLIEAIRDNLDSSERRASYAQGKGKVYEYFAAFLEVQGREAEALAYTERARSRSLLDLLYTVQRSEERQGATPVDRLIGLNRQLGALAQDLEEEAVMREEQSSAYASERVSQLRREYARADSIYLQVEGQLSSAQQIYTFNPLRPDAIRSMLEEGEAMIIFDLREGKPQHEGVTSVAYVVLPETIHTYPLDVEPEALAETIRFFRDHIGSTQPGERWEPIARRLYRDLMQPLIDTLPDDVRHLHIIPEGTLHYLPFAALQNEEGQFLVEQFSLSVAPSASILSLTRQQNPREWQSMMLLGDPDGRLPGSRDEVLGIAGSENVKQNEVLLGKAATKAAVTQLAPISDVIHFATHGRFVKQDPARSHLELHGEEVLSVEEIGKLKLRAYLVTLSACETAISGGRIADVPDGDEWVGFNQAFLAAGTPTVMASLWPIDDRVSSTFMIDFYKKLRVTGKAQALAEVQRRFIQDARTRHPFYWAPFTVVGDPL